MKYFQTSDKKLFYVEDLARNHARSLEDKTVKKVDSTQLKAESKEKTTANKKINHWMPDGFCAIHKAAAGNIPT